VRRRGAPVGRNGIEVIVRHVLIRGWLGHADISTTNLYAEINTKVKEAALRPQNQDSVPGHRILQYAEEHPGEVLVAIDDKTDALIRELEQQERAAHRSLRRRPPLHSLEQLVEVPF
jgi:hypothetical protein